MMRLTLAASVAAAAFTLGACAYEPDYYDGPPYSPAYPENAYGPGAYAPGYAYEDPCMNDPGYCNYSYYEGPVWWGGSWYYGPHRWRDYGGGRQFWVHGGWQGGVRLGRGGAWRGPGRWRHR